MQGIQEEVEGIGKSARGDLKKSGSKAIADGKKSASAAAKKGTAAATAGSNPARSTALGKTTSKAKEAGANGARVKSDATASSMESPLGHFRPPRKPTHWPMSRFSTSTLRFRPRRTAPRRWQTERPVRMP